MQALILGTAILVIGQGPEPIDPGIGSVKLGTVNLSLFDLPRNRGRDPEQWQFRYQPAFAPKIDRNGKIVVSGPTRLPSGKYELSIELLLSTNKLDELAFEEVKKRLPKQAERLKKRNVFVWSVKWLRLAIPKAIQGKFPDLSLAQSEWHQDTNNAIVVRLHSDSEVNAKELIESIDSLGFQIEYSQTAASTIETTVQIKAGDVRQSRLYARLKGLGTDPVYVRRFDLRELGESIRGTLDIFSTIEDPDRFDSTLATKLADQAQAKLLDSAAEKFDEEKWKSTYNGDDLRPTILQEIVNKAFSYDNSTKQFKLNSALDSSAEVSFVKIFGARGDLKANYSTDDFVNMLRQRNIEVSLKAGKNGVIVIPKSVDVLRINVSQFDQEFSLKWMETVIEPPKDIQKLGTIELGDRAEQASKVLEDLEAQQLANRVEASAKFADLAKTQADAEFSRVKDWEPNSLTEDSLKHLDNGKMASSEASGVVADAGQLRAEGLFESALKQFKSAGDKYLEARRSFSQVRQKADGYITKIEVSTNIGPEDMETNGYLVVVVGDKTLTLGFDKHWVSNKAGPSGSLDNLRIDLKSPVEVKAGLQNQPHERNVVVDADFKITIHTVDLAGTKDSLSVPVSMARYSTNGKGLGASDIKNAHYIHRYDLK